MYFPARGSKKVFPLLFFVSLFSLPGTGVMVMGWLGGGAQSPSFDPTEAVLE